MSVRKEPERQKYSSGRAKKYANDPKPPFPRQRGHGRNGDRNLEHGHATRKNLVPVKVWFRFSLLFSRIFLDLGLFFLIPFGLGLVLFVSYAAERDFSVEHCRFNSFRLIIGPM